MTANTNLDGGWIKWDGEGEPPTGKVEVRLREGTEWTPPDPTVLAWHHSPFDPEGDIVAYRFTK